MLYELNNNKEVDNGMLINTKINTNTNSLIENDLNDNNNQVKTESVLYFEEEGNIEDDKKYVKECLEKNILCQATAVYFLLMNYDSIN